MLNLAESQHVCICLCMCASGVTGLISRSERPVIRYTTVCSLHTRACWLCIIWMYDACHTFLLTLVHACNLTFCIQLVHGTHAHTHTHSTLQFCILWANDARQANLHQSFILSDQMMRVSHIGTHTSFVLCDQMMRVPMKLVTSIQQCPVLFCSHPYCDSSFDAL